MVDYSYEIGVNAGARQNVEDLGIVPPRSEHHEWAVAYSTGDGGEAGDGFPMCEWYFDFLTAAMMNTLLGYIVVAAAPVQSAVVSINTKLNSGAYQPYATAVIHRPKVPSEGVRVYGGWRNVKFRFTRLEE